MVLTALEARRQPPETALRVGLLVRLVRRPLWRLAATLDLAGWALKTVALLIAPLTVVAPAMALGLFLLLLFSAIVLDEPVRPSSLAGVALLAGGVALVALHSPEREVTVASPLSWSLCILLLLAVALAPYVARARGLPVDVRVVALAYGFAWALNGVLSKLMADSIDTGRWVLFGGALAGAFCVGAVGYLAKTSALQSGEAATVESIAAVVNTLVPVALAPLLFGEDWPDSPGRAAQLALGVTMVGVGVYLVTHATAGALARAERGRPISSPS